MYISVKDRDFLIGLSSIEGHYIIVDTVSRKCVVAHRVKGGRLFTEAAGTIDDDELEDYVEDGICDLKGATVAQEELFEEAIHKAFFMKSLDPTTVKSNLKFDIRKHVELLPLVNKRFLEMMKGRSRSIDKIRKDLNAPGLSELHRIVPDIHNMYSCLHITCNNMDEDEISHIKNSIDSSLKTGEPMTLPKGVRIDYSRSELKEGV